MVLAVVVHGIVAGCASDKPVETAPARPADASGPLSLSPDLRAILLEEMRALDRALPDLERAVAGGDLAAAARLGDEMAGTFILRRKLTRAQHHELHHSVPREFLDMDHRFHDGARALADAARASDAEAVAARLDGLREACARCHVRFAPGAGGER